MINSALNKLNLQEIRIIFLLSSLIKPKDKQFYSYRIKIKEIMNFLNLTDDQSYYTKIRKITYNLLEKVIIIKDVEKKQEIQTSWITSVIYYERKGIIELKISPELREYLLNLKETFTEEELKQMLSLKSIHSMRMYELLILNKYERKGEKFFLVEELKMQLGLTKTYKRYTHFKNKVLLSVQKELKEKTDFFYEFQEHKTEKRVTAVTLYIQSFKPQQKVVISQATYEILTEEYLLSATQALEIIKNFDNEYIIQTLENIDKLNKNKKIGKLGTYTYKTFKDKYNYQSTLNIYQEGLKDDRNKSKGTKVLKESYDNYLKEELDRIKSNLSKDELKDMYKKIEDQMKKAKKKFIIPSIINIKIDEELIKEYNILLFDDWCKS